LIKSWVTWRRDEDVGKDVEPEEDLVAIVIQEQTEKRSSYAIIANVVKSVYEHVRVKATRRDADETSAGSDTWKRSV
jgi:hypothetical protein